MWFLCVYNDTLGSNSYSGRDTQCMELLDCDRTAPEGWEHSQRGSDAHAHTAAEIPELQNRGSFR